MKIYKFPLMHLQSEDIELPQGSRVLSAGEQDGTLCVWVQINEQGRPVPYTFYMFGTGDNMLAVKLNTSFINTVQMPSGLVWHIFYKTEGY